ncbi:MAG TPA: hypothetical protein VGC36_15305, partial [Rhizomicrobium sp.]
DIVGAHCIGFAREVVADLAGYLERILASGDHPPIDGAYVWYRREHPEVKTVFAVPPIGVQRPSRTDIGELGFLDRLPLLSGALAVARKLKRRLKRVS